MTIYAYNRKGDMTTMTTHTTPTTDTTTTPATKGSRRGRDTIEVAIPDGRDTSTIGNPIHVDSDVLYKAIELLQVIVLTLDSLKDEGADLGVYYRLRIATRRITTQFEEAILADWDTDYGEPCRAFIAELTGAPTAPPAQDAPIEGVYDHLTTRTASRSGS